MRQTKFDAVVVGSGPNGLAAGITMQRAGLSVLIVEGKETIGGGMRSLELTLPGFVHDVCSAIHPFVQLSPFFRSLPLQDFGLKMIRPGLSAAHPFEHGGAAVLDGTVAATAARLGRDADRYTALMQPVVDMLPGLLPQLLGPFSLKGNLADLLRFGLKALPSALSAGEKFVTAEARGLWAGMAAHAMQPLQNVATSAFALMLMATAHLGGWPVAAGGSQSIADAMAAYFKSLGGTIETGHMVTDLRELPSANVVLLDVTPRQLLSLAGDRLGSFYRSRLQRYRYGMGTFKIDWALEAPAPFEAQECRRAGTVHLGNTLEEIAQYEKSAFRGQEADKPFVLYTQSSVFDPSRTPDARHTAWAYCHVPHGSTRDMTTAIESQVERFAPGFRDLIIDRHTMNTAALEQYNPNYIGGDINGGLQDIFQLYTRPLMQFSPYRTSAPDIFLCSSATPPGGGVHGMCGYHAAKQALKDVFKINSSDAIVNSLMI
ncbi:phytoene desaturase family protein [Dyadobacter sandarakinus]|uniref:NAD(P)/FAD-dependent oxidoreductase n=1 Tax=Dyadobacter sandarakinus TaxID=2747268 RepID=A0ABX7I8G5_9BACT|nr:NAD(P)/FAD-dependent oxidoreductase [Dyadobacter sandarakinus]QRR02123.1 NAD(P)/FAD-dependent oxidoreductase [Dyadobacter sandarakinus]